MSVDVHVSAEHCCEGHSVNFTYNYSPALREAGMPPWRAFDSILVAHASWVIEYAYGQLAANVAYFEKLIKGDGEWGTMETLLDSLRELRRQMRVHPEGRLRCHG